MKNLLPFLLLSSSLFAQNTPSNEEHKEGAFSVGSSAQVVGEHSPLTIAPGGSFMCMELHPADTMMVSYCTNGEIKAQVGKDKVFLKDSTALIFQVLQASLVNMTDTLWRLQAKVDYFQQKYGKVNIVYEDDNLWIKPAAVSTKPKISPKKKAQ